MGGKSRKTGGVSRDLIDRLLAGKGKGKGPQKPSQKESPLSNQGLGLKSSNEK